MSLRFILLFYALRIAFSHPCIPRKYDQDSFVCVCNETYCDTYEKVSPLKKGSFVQYISSADGLRLHRSEGKFQSATGSFLSYEVNISPSIKYQRIVGWGGHFTDTTGKMINDLPAKAQHNFLMSYWSDLGSEYSLSRIPMGGTDFSPRYYTYMDKYEKGMQLIGFNLTEEDYTLKIPHILAAMKISRHPIRFVATPWTAPPWMKTENRFSGGELKEEYYQAFAEYYTKFLDAYKSQGVHFWAITTGNEPANGYVPSILTLPSMAWYPPKATKWLKQNLGPTIRNSKSFKNTKILIHDDQRSILPSLQIFCLDEEAMQYADGIATHWYADFYTPEQLLYLAKCPNKENTFSLMTEATEGIFQNAAISYGSWARAETYINSIMTYMNYNFVGWMDWNLALNTKGGPNLTGYSVDSCIIVNGTAKEFYKQPTFYAMAHFSKFVPPDSVRIDSKCDGKLIGFFLHIKVVAFKRPDGGIVVVLHNEEDTYVDVDIKDQARGQIKLGLKPKSITTVLYW